MKKSLLPLTKFALALTAIVPTVFALTGLLAPGLINTLLWPPPLEGPPLTWIRYTSAIYLALATGAAYAFRQDNWSAARIALIVGAVYNALDVLFTIPVVTGTPRVPLIVWLFVVLGVIYVAVVVAAWRQESAHA